MNFWLIYRYSATEPRPLLSTHHVVPQPTTTTITMNGPSSSPGPGPTDSATPPTAGSGSDFPDRSAGVVPDSRERLPQPRLWSLWLGHRTLLVDGLVVVLLYHLRLLYRSRQRCEDAGGGSGLDGGPFLLVMTVLWLGYEVVAAWEKGAAAP
ncbi:hypothetical protein B0I35DRAFT_478706 [Stachybotrys elegans]|uniref:Uncharacterized protein n=1 Tax=Stachybotrys elegans TaxID=80388 RepID=A0A8K0SR81_9HYPO|nr:hypothetical protein B0I35DRAFT_478706 [Stachybotrys elegans]